MKDSNGAKQTPPKKSLNFVIKQEIFQTLRRTDVYYVNKNLKDVAKVIRLKLKIGVMKL